MDTGLEWSTNPPRCRETRNLNSIFNQFALLTIRLDRCRPDSGNSLVAYFPSIRVQRTAQHPEDTPYSTV